MSEISTFGWPAPTLEDPLDGTSQWTGLYLDWDAVSGSDAYQLQVSSSSGFTTLVLDTHKTYINSSDNNNDTREWVEDLDFGATYYWRVRAYVTGDTSSWTVRSFNTKDDVKLEDPLDGSTEWVGLNIDWDAHIGVDEYQYQLDTSASFSSPVMDEGFKSYINSSDNNNDTRQWSDGLYFGEEYHWRVRAINANDTSAWSNVRSFTTKDEVVLEDPFDGSSEWVGLNIDWDAFIGVDEYQYQLDTSASFSSPVMDEGFKSYINGSDNNNDTRQWYDGLYFGEEYHWRVRAIHANDTSAWSNVRSFTTKDEVVLEDPLDGSTEWAGLNIDWDAFIGVDEYQYQLDTSASFSSPVMDEGFKSYINGSSNNNDTRQFVDDLYFGTQYHWRVRAITSVDTSSWGQVRTFTTRDEVVLQDPIDGKTNVDVGGHWLNWDAHVGVDTYEVELDTSNLFNTSALQYWDLAYINGSSNNSDTELYSDSLEPNTVYFWRVRAINMVDTTSWTTWNFSTGNAIDPPAVPTLLAPADGSTGRLLSLVLDWSNANNAQQYEVHYSKDPSLSNPQADTVGSSQLSLSGLMADTTYYWRVRSMNGGFVSGWSNIRWFGTYLEKPVLDVPADSASDRPIDNLLMDWNPVEGAASYDLLYSPDSSFGSNVDSVTVSGTQTTVSGLLPDTTYYWRVTAHNSATSSDPSDTWEFSTDSLSVPAVPTLSSPADQITGRSLSQTLVWNASTNATHYQYQLDTDSTFSSPMSSLVMMGTDTGIATLMVDTTYYWRVRAYNQSLSSGWSSTWSFATYLKQPLLNLPADQSSGHPVSGVTLDWQSVEGGTDHRYQYSVDSTFAASVDSGMTASTQVNTASLTYDTTYFWRVKALNAATESPWSDIRSFRTEMDTTTRIEEMQPKEDLSVIADGRRVVLKWRGKSRTDFQVHLIGPRGKLVEAYSWETTDLLRLDVDPQARGIYFLKVFGERGVIGTRKVLLPE